MADAYLEKKVVELEKLGIKLNKTILQELIDLNLTEKKAKEILISTILGDHLDTLRSYLKALKACGKNFDEKEFDFMINLFEKPKFNYERLNNEN